MRFWHFLAVLAACFNTSAQESPIQSGPMIGYVDMREVLIWVQTNRPAEVQIQYREKDSKTEPLYTQAVEAMASHAYAVKLVADQVQPGRSYEYEVLVDGETIALPYPTTFDTQSIWRYRTDPPDFTVALGSCTYINEPEYDRPGDGYGGNYEIFEAIDRYHPDMMLWLGDNNYLREPDWWTRTGIFHRYTHTRSLPEMQPLLARTANYAIWDDHDFGPNDSDRSWINKDIAKEAFDAFWGNPGSGLPGNPGGITTMFRYNDIDFFLLDNRYFRSPNDMANRYENEILGEEQLNWLIEALVSSDATFKLVCIGGQVLNDAEKFEIYKNVAPRERDELLRRIASEGIKNVVFITGDRHHGELNKLRLNEDVVVYDFTASPLTSGSGRIRNEVNENRVEGTLVTQRNFGFIEFSGPQEARKMRMSIRDVAGEEIWDYEIEAQ
ncbi:MAG: alkaline phosphatase D family protein [Bacteroidota bacterium]